MPTTVCAVTEGARTARRDHTPGLPYSRGAGRGVGRGAGRGRGGRARGRGRGRASGTASVPELLLPDRIQPEMPPSKLWSPDKKMIHVKGLGQNKAQQLYSMYSTCEELSETSREAAHNKIEALKARLKAEIVCGVVDQDLNLEEAAGDRRVEVRLDDGGCGEVRLISA